MKLQRFLAVCALLAVSAAALADFRITSLAHEVLLGDLQLPVSINGTTSFKACDTCNLRKVRVSAATRYQLNGEAVPLDEFRRALAGVPPGDSRIAIVMHHLESDLVTQILIRL